MSRKIPVKVIFSSEDKLCPAEKQLHYLNKIPNRGEYVYIPENKHKNYKSKHGD